MKRLLLCSLIAMNGIAFGKELVVIPEVLTESKMIENNESTVIVENIISETIEVDEVSLNNIYFRAGISPFAGYNKFSAKFDKESKKVTDGKPDSLGYELGVEYTRNLSDNLELGLGTMYQSNSKLKSYTVERGVKSQIGKYDSLPVYLTTKYSFEEFGNGVKPYLKGNIGYSFNFNEKNGYFSDKDGKYPYSSKVTNGAYLALGGGVEYNNIGIDLMYQVTGADLTIKDKEDGIKTKKDSFANAKITLGVSYKFEY
ncbi:outer membrane beta-barrel protein [Cetobacterium somerae]